MRGIESASPTESPQTNPAGRNPATTAAPPPGASRIFIVEDDSTIADLISAFLGRSGYSVAGRAQAGDEALLQIEMKRPDLVLMDITLEGELDGIQTASAIAERHEIPVVFVTGLADEETMARARRAKASGCLIKPFEREDLQSSINLALGRHREETRLRQVERWFLASMRSISDAVVAADASGRIEFLNAAAEALLARQAADIIGLPLGSVIQLDDESDRTPSTLSPPSAAPGPGDVRFENLLRRPDGTSQRIECVSQLNYGDNGRIVGRVLILRALQTKHAPEAPPAPVLGGSNEAQTPAGPAPESAGREGGARALHHTLSSRESEVLRRIGSGRTVSQIASDLQLSVKTISTYRARLLEKMGMRTNAELTRYAIKNHLVD